MNKLRNWKKIGTIAVCIALMAAMLLSCGPKEMTITVANETGWGLSELYIAPSAGSGWGQSYLNANLNDRGVQEITLSEQADFYDIWAVTEYGDELDYYDVPLQSGGSMIIVDDGESTYLEVTTKKGEETIIEGIYTAMESPGDDLEDPIPEEDEYADVEESQVIEEPESNWLELTIYNETDLTITEVYAYEMDSSDPGYNHIESYGTLAPDDYFDLGVDLYSYYHMEFYDDLDGVMVFFNVILEDAAYADVIWGDSDPVLSVTYSDGSIYEFEGMYG